jgi:PST family polysaccharide transporter
LVGQAFLSVAMFAVKRHAVSPTLKLRRVSNLVSYGGGLTLARFLNQLAQNGDYFVIGRVMGPTALGFYERAFKVMQTPTSLLGTVLDRVLFPAMSQIQNDNERLKRGFGKAISVGYAAQIPVCVAIAVTAPEIVALILGPGWEQSVAPLRVLALSIPLRIMVRLSDSLVRAKGAVYSSAVIKGVFATLVLLGSYFGARWGITGVATGVLIAVCANYGFMAQLSHKLIGASWKYHVRLLAPGLAIGGATLAIGLPIQVAARALTGSPALRLLIFVVVVGIALRALLSMRPRLLGPDVAFVKHSFVAAIGNNRVSPAGPETLSADTPHNIPESPLG